MRRFFFKKAAFFLDLIQSPYCGEQGVPLAFVQVTVEPGGTTTVVLDGGEPPPMDRQPVKPNRAISKTTPKRIAIPPGCWSPKLFRESGGKVPCHGGRLIQP